MSHVVFDPLDASAISRGLVPWTAALLVPAPAVHQDDLVQRTIDSLHEAETCDPQDLTGFARQERRRYLAATLRRLTARVAALLRPPVRAQGEQA